jgi:multiple sugar transport system permease protein
VVEHAPVDDRQGSRLVAQNSWHELLIPLILNSKTEFMTLPVVIASLVGDVHVFFNLMMATCLLALLPSVILVLLLQKFVVQGLSVGAVKG